MPADTPAVSPIPAELARRFHSLGGSAAVAMALVGWDGVLRELNPSFANLLGASPGALQGLPLVDLLLPADVGGYERLRGVHERRGVENGFHWIDLRWRARGEPVATRASMGVLADEAGRSALTLFVERRAMRLQAVGGDGAAVAALCRQIVDMTPEPLLVVAADGLIQLASRGAQELFRLDQAQLRGVGVDSLLAPRGGRSGNIVARLELALRHDRSEYIEQPAGRSDGSGFTAGVEILPLEDQGQRLALLRLRDVTEDKRRQQQLANLASFDAVTGLSNRVLLVDRLEQALQRAQREDKRVVLLFLDLDRFKHFNETLGHRAGDSLLTEVAARLRRCLRKSDSVARLGGDEFAMVLEGDGALINAGRIAHKVLDSIAEPVILDGRELFLTASIGVAIFEMDGDTADQMLRHAEMAMYRAKDLGRNRYCFYAPAMGSAAADRLQIESDLRRALEREEFVLYYQPQVDAAAGKVVGVEALLRWKRHDRLVPPAEFVPVLEETRLIVPVGAWVLETACRQAVQLERDGGAALTVAVNISAHQFRDPGLVESVARVLAATGLPQARLELEITETLLMERTAQAHETLARLDALGVRIALDDFGTGYSSLAYLKHFPVDALKIDGSFIGGIPNDRDDVAIATAIIAMAEQLDLRVVAEAVETPAQLSFLQRWPGVLVQGYLFAPALPAAALPARVVAIETALAAGRAAG